MSDSDRIAKLEKELIQTRRGLQQVCKHHIVPDADNVKGNKCYGVCRYCGYINYLVSYNVYDKKE